MSARRCVLFVPGSRPERFPKAHASGADMVCIDLEDAVEPAAKAAARSAALGFLAAAPGGCEWVLRVNALRTADGLADLLALRDATTLPALLMLPKSACATELEIVRDVLGARCPPLIALIESAAGVEAAYAIARCPAVAMLMFGGADYMAELGGTLCAEAVSYARARIAAAAGAVQKIAIDVPYLDVQDETGLRAETAHVARLGFACKAAIHPTQVGPIQASYTPSAAALSQAERILSAYAAQPHGALLVDGKLVDRPVLLAAERVVARAGLNPEHIT